ncbi:MAG: YhfC family glutamic-type intramembrane protease [Actinomycetota bacterium]|jgi:uncharacterized membrane protein YhfC|nr:YhfC family glutamic-type intramembrane protease [Actinomycetota bacterium]
MLKDASFIFAIILEIGVPILIASFIAKRFKVSWKIFFIGLALFLVSLIRIPLNSIVPEFLRFNFMGEKLIILSILFPSFTAALFEEGLRTLGIGLIIKQKNFYKGLMYGIGHGGGGESMIFVGFSLLANYIAYKLFGSLPMFAALKANFDSINWYMPLIGAGERMMTIAIQLAFSVLVMAAFLKKKYYLIIIAFIMHIAVDFIAVYLAVKTSTLWSELSVLLFAIIGVLIIIFFYRDYKNNEKTAVRT